MDNFFCKKRLTIFSILFLLFCSTLLFGCGKVDLNESQHTYISEYRKNLFINKTSLFFASFTSGERETEYILDGQKTNLTDFGVLTVKFSTDIGNILPRFELNVNDKIYLGEMEHNPYDNTYVFDIETQVEDNDEITLKLLDFEQNIKLVCVSKDWKSTWEESVKTFNSFFDDKLQKHTNNAKFEGEIYVKIVSDSKNVDNFYWYILCVCEDGNVYSCLIDVNTNEIVQSK